MGAAVSRLNLGSLAVVQGEPVRAERLLREALLVFRRLGDEDASAECLDSLAGAAGARGDGERAATLFGAAEAAREQLGTPIRPVDRAKYERFVAASQRGGEAWTTAWAAGRTMSLEQATGYALSHESTIARPARSSLTPRELEVAHLVAQGLTNRRISEKLYISERTVATHVARCLKKLGLRSRSGLAAWISTEKQPLPDPT